MDGKLKPYKMWQAGISLAASPLANSLAGFAREVIYGGSAAARPLTNPASYAGYDYPCLGTVLVKTVAREEGVVYVFNNAMAVF